jgi:hypothetical protein
VTTYYFDYTGGSDSNDGLSESGAWKTLNKLVTESGSLVAGDVVKFKKGEVFREPTNGTVDFQGGVTYTSYGSGNRPVLEGIQRVTGWTLDAGSRYSASFTRADSTDAMLWEDGVAGTKEVSAAAVGAAREFYLDDAGNTLYYQSSDGTDPDNFVIHFSHGTSLPRFRIAGSNGVLQGLDFAFGTAVNALVTGNFGTTQNGWYFENCVFRNAGLHGFQQFFSAGGSINMKNCTFHTNRQIGCVLDGGVNNSLLEGCVAYGNGLGNEDAGDGFLVKSTGSGLILRNCTAYQNRAFGIGVTTGSTNVLVEDCTAYENAVNHPDAGGFSANGTSITFRRCVSYDNGLVGDTTLGSGFNTDLASDGTVFEYCLAYNNHSHGFGIASKSGGTLGHTMYNCTAADNGNPGTNASVGYGVSIYGANDFASFTMNNCLLYDNWNTAGTSYAFYDNGGRAEPSADLDYNMYYDRGDATNLINWNNTNYATLSAFTTAVTTQEANGLEGDPDVTNYRPSGTSGAVGAGTDLGVHNYDTYGHRITKTPPDIGAVISRILFASGYKNPTSSLPVDNQEALSFIIDQGVTQGLSLQDDFKKALADACSISDYNKYSIQDLLKKYSEL